MGKWKFQKLWFLAPKSVRSVRQREGEQKYEFLEKEPYCNLEVCIHLRILGPNSRALYTSLGFPFGEKVSFIWLPKVVQTRRVLFSFSCKPEAHSNFYCGLNLPTHPKVSNVNGS